MLRVEVKGTTTSGSQILLTPNEVANATTSYPNVALFVLRDIQLQVVESGVWEASGGSVHVFQPWSIDPGSLTSIGFMYAMPDA